MNSNIMTALKAALISMLALGVLTTAAVAEPIDEVTELTATQMDSVVAGTSPLAREIKQSFLPAVQGARDRICKTTPCTGAFIHEAVNSILLPAVQQLPAVQK